MAGSQQETWIREIHADVREIRSELATFRGDMRRELVDMRDDVTAAKAVVTRIEALEDKEERRSQRATAFAAPFFAAVIGGLIAVAPHIP